MPHITLNVYRDSPPSKTKPSHYKAALTAARRMGYHVGDEEANVPHGRQESDPDTTTTGATDPAGMKTDLVASFPLQGARYIYTAVTNPNGDWIIYRRDMQQQSTVPPEQMSGTYEAGENSFLWADMTTTDYRIWRTVRQTTANDPWNRGSGSGYDAQDRPMESLMNSVSARTMRTPNDTGSEIFGVGGESRVGKRSNTTGYSISTGDAAARPGLVIGRSNAALVARRAAALQQINVMNKKAWS